MNLLTIGKLNDYLVDIENQVENMFLQIVKQLANSESITEELKAKNPTLWYSQLNNIRERATEIVNAEIIYVQRRKNQLQNITTDSFFLW